MPDSKKNTSSRPKGQRWTLLPNGLPPGRRTLQGAAATLLHDLDAALMRQRRGLPTDERKAALMALTACMAFLASAARRTNGPKALRIMAAHGLVRSLGGALVELDAGIVAPVLKPGPKSNRSMLPSNIQQGRAVAAVAVHGMFLGGFSIKEAADFVAKEIKGRPELDGITREPWKAVIRWRQDMMGAKDRVPLDSLKDVPHSRADVALFDEWTAMIQERIAEGSWGRQSGVAFAQITLLTYLPPLPKKPL